MSLREPDQLSISNFLAGESSTPLLIWGVPTAIHVTEVPVRTYQALMRISTPNPEEVTEIPSYEIEREVKSKIRSVDLLIHRSSPNETDKKNEVRSHHEHSGHGPAPQYETKQVTYTNRLIAPSISVNLFDTFDVSQSKEGPTGKKNQEALGFDRGKDLER